MYITNHSQILTWDKDKNEICETIRKRKVFMKIILKTKDEIELLERYIEHYSKIVGYDGLIIADNMSEDPRIYDIYKKYLKEIIIFKYEFPNIYASHDAIHNKHLFADFYTAISQSCEYFALFDNDEFLILIDPEHEKWYADEKIVDYIKSINPKRAIPTIWLFNIPYKDDVFKFDTKIDNLKNCVKFGKVILPANLSMEKQRILSHNIGIHSSLYGDFPINNLFLLHLSTFSIERSLRISKEKLIKRKIIKKESSYEEIITMDINKLSDGSAIEWIKSIKRLLEIKERKEPFVENLPPYSIRLLPSNDIQFLSPECREKFKNFLSKKEIIKEFLSWKELYSSAISCKNQGNNTKWIFFLKVGEDLYPEQLDAYGHPFFRKELMRAYLSQNDFLNAIKLISLQSNNEERKWYSILLARYFTENKDFLIAKYWWKKAQKYYPNHEEIEMNLKKIESTLSQNPNFALSRGLNPLRDILSKLPDFVMNIIVDVGGAFGERTMEFLKFFPDAKIFVFEPLSLFYKNLLVRFKDYKNVIIENLALSDNCGEGFILVNKENPKMSKLIESISTSTQNLTKEKVKVVTGDSYFKTIPQIDYLKIDTEGHDLRVLKGFEEKIKNGKIKFIEVEASTNKKNTFHVFFTEMLYYLEPFGFDIFGIYEQVGEWGNRCALRRANILFVRE